MPISATFSVTSLDLPNLNGIVLDSNGVIWAVGESGYVIHSMGRDLEWQETSLGGSELLGITKTPKGTLLISSRNGTIYRSTDGKSWQRLDTRSTADLYSIYASDAAVWAGGASGTLLRSDDDGVTWNRVNLDTDKRVRSIFASDRNVYLVGEAGLVFVGGQAGKSWQYISTGTNEELNGVYATRDDNAVIAVGDKGHVLRSIDHGLHWSGVDLGLHVDLIAISGNGDGSQVLAEGGDGVLVESKSSGDRWERVALPQNRSLRALVLGEDRKFFVAGLQGVVAGGAPDAEPSLLHGVPIRVEGISQTNHFGLVAYGQGGTILTSRDSGGKWVRQSLPTDATITGVSESGKTLWVTGEHGTVAQTTDGTKWTFAKNLPDIRLNAIAASEDGRFVYAVGKNGVVLKSTNSGVDWTSEVSASGQDLLSVIIRNRTVFAAGNQGTVLRAEIAGSGWKGLPTNTSLNLQALVGTADGKSVWAFGQNGGVFYTHDTGDSWDFDDNSVNDDLAAAVCLEDCKQIVAVGDNGTVVYHQGADKDWTYSSKTRFTLRSITVLPNKSILALGPAFMLFRPKTITGAWQQDEYGDAASGYTDEGGRNIWVVADGGAISHSSDFGAHWQTTRLEDREDLLSVTGDVSGLRLWAVGEHGLLATSRNHGVDWATQRISSSSLSCVRKVGNDVWVLGTQSTLLKENADQTRWDRLKISWAATLRDIAGTSNGQELWIVGSRGTILHSTNSGLNWAKQSSNTVVDLYAIALLEGGRRRLVAVGEGGTALLSHDGGEHWYATNLGGGKIFDLVQSQRTKQLLAVGENGRILFSDDEGESWYRYINSGTTNSLLTLAPVAGGEKFYAFGNSGTFIKYSMGSVRFTVNGIHMDRALTNIHAHIDLAGLKSDPSPEFRIRAVRLRELDRSAPVEKAAKVTKPNPGESEWTTAFDLADLNPRRGESFDLQLCMTQSGFSRCFPLPRLTIVPLIDYQKNKWWIIPGAVLAAFVGVLTVLLYIRPMLILSLYRNATVYDAIEKSLLPGAGLIKVLLTGTFVPLFAFHRRTLIAWVETHRHAFRERWTRDVSSVVSRSTSFYVPLPVEVDESNNSQLVTAPSLATLGQVMRESKGVQILGPGGIGKTTLLCQFSAWLFDPKDGEQPRLKSCLPLLVDLQNGSLRDFVKRKIENITDEELSPELAKRLFSNLMLILFVDGVSELSPEVQRSLVQGLEELSVKGFVLSSRRPVEIASIDRITLYPKPLDSKTLLYFITALLTRLPEEEAHLNTMQLQLELGNRVVRAMTSEGQEIPLTPLLVTLYVERAIELLQRHQTLNELPSTAAEAYFDFLRQLFRDTAQIGADRMLAVVKAMAKLSLGDRFVPEKFSADSALSSMQSIVGSAGDAALKSLIYSGILIGEEMGLGRSLHFVFDPLAEFCAAYAYAEDLGRDREEWDAFLERVKSMGNQASGFRSALKLIIQTYGPRGIFPSDLPIDSFET